MTRRSLSSSKWNSQQYGRGYPVGSQDGEDVVGPVRTRPRKISTENVVYFAMKDAKIAELSFLEVVPRLNGTKDLDDCLKEALERRRKVTRLLEVGKRNYEIIV